MQRLLLVSFHITYHQSRLDTRQCMYLEALYNINETLIMVSNCGPAVEQRLAPSDFGLPLITLFVGTWCILTLLDQCSKPLLVDD